MNVDCMYKHTHDTEYIILIYENIFLVVGKLNKQMLASKLTIDAIHISLYKLNHHYHQPSSPSLDIGLFNSYELGYSYPGITSHAAKIVTLPSLKATYL